MEKLMKEDRKVLTEVPKELPVQFEPVVIERQARGTGIHYRAVLVWQRVGTQDQVEQAMNLFAEKKPPAVVRPVQSVELRIRFVAEGGKLCGHETVILNPTESSGSVVLSQFGKSCSPVRLIAEVVSVSFRSPPPPPEPEQKAEPEDPPKGDLSKS